MKSRKDPAEYDGKGTLVDALPEAMGERESGAPARPAARDAAGAERDEPATAATDVEEQPTEQWASAANLLFATETQHKKAAEWEGLDEVDFEAHLSALSAPLPRQGDTLLDVPLERAEPAQEPAAARVSLRIEPEEMRTDLDSTLSDALSNEEESDTVEMTPEEAAAAIRSAQATLDAVMSKQGADQPRAGREVAAPGQVAEGALSDPGQLTVMVKEPAEGSPLTHQCRICGRSITRPHPVRFRGLATSQRGFRCESCHNTVCAAHATRVSGFWESLFKQGRFCCVLCLLSTQRRDKSPS